MILYTCPAGVQAVLKHIRFVNTDETNPHDFIYYSNGSDPENQLSATITLDPGQVYTDTDAYTLEEGDTIEATFTDPDVISYHVFGLESISP